MKLNFFFLICSLTFSVFAQNQALDIKWGIKDRANYDIVFGEKITDKNTLNLFISRGCHDSLVQNILFDLVDNQFKKKKFKCSIKRSHENFISKLKIYGIKSHKAMFNPKGQAIAKVKPLHENIYNFFYSLPKNKVSIGDVWKFNFKLPSSHKNMNLKYSNFKNEIVFEKIVNVDKRQMALFKTLYEVEISSEFVKDKSREGRTIVSYISITEFDIESQKIHKIRGFLISNDTTMNELTIQLIGMRAVD